MNEITASYVNVLCLETSYSIFWAIAEMTLGMMPCYSSLLMWLSEVL